MPLDTDYAWAAGIIDGEGAITMTRSRPGVNRRTTLSFQVRISVRMTHEPTIRRLYRIFGGTVKLSRSLNPIKHRDSFDWFVGDLKTVSVLNLAARYMTTKAAHAKLVLEYRRKCINLQPNGRCVCCHPRLVKRRAAYFERLKALNRRGPQ